MRSFRTRFTILTVCVAILSVSIVSATSVLFIKNNEHRKSDQLLLLLCETGEKNLDYYFNSVQKSVGRVASFTEADIDGLDDKSLEKHMERVEEYFDEMAHKTNGVLTYYYRIDPEVSKNVKGFVMDLNFNTKQVQLVELILNIAEDLKIPVIAEGVETPEQLSLLQELGCTIAQGYYFSKPIPPEKFEQNFLDN